MEVSGAPRRVPRRLGDVLVSNGVITPEELQKALAEQEKTREHLGRILIRLGYATEREVTSALAEHLGLPQVEFLRVSEPGVLTVLSEQQARRYKAFPLERKGNRLKIALADPTNPQVIDDLRLITGLEIEPFLAGEREIEGAIQKYYGLPGLEKAFQEFQVLEAETLQLEPEETALDEAPAVKLLNSIIVQAIEEQASDIHIEPTVTSVRVRYRVDGMLREVMELPRRARASLAARVKILAQLDITERRLPQDGRIQIRYQNREIDLRVSTLPTVFGENIVIRLLDKERRPQDLAALGFAAENLARFERIINSAYGLVLLTGPTGSGKTTTLYTALRRVNTPEKKIITIEDPVEYVLEGINQCQVAPKIGFTFATGLRAMLRQDPDIIMVGEIRDLETANIAVQAAVTGHLVFSTLHTNNAVGAVIRLLEMGVEPFLVASSLVGVVSQRLVRVLCRHCRETFAPAPISPERAFLGVGPGEPVVLCRGKGCGYCGRTGYRGRISVQEVLVLTPEFRKLVTAGASADEMEKLAVAQGMATLREDALRKVGQGITSVSEVARVLLTEPETL